MKVGWCMWPQITGVMDEHRRSKPLAELERKAKKAKRRGIWTQEEVDLATVEGMRLFELFACADDVHLDEI